MWESLPEKEKDPHTRIMLSPHLSVIIPAYNEGEMIEKTLSALILAINESGISAEILVSDDASTDNTAEIAHKYGATVVFSGKRNIAATRNVGACAANGRIFLFLDADTIVEATHLRELLLVLDSGAIGGGAEVDWSEPTSIWLRIAAWFWNRYTHLSHSPAGSFFFMKREAFEAVGGFDEEFYVSEELHLGRKLKKIGRLAIISTPVRTSPRKGFDFTLKEHLRLMARMLLAPGKTVRDPKHLDIWYTRRSATRRNDIQNDRQIMEKTACHHEQMPDRMIIGNPVEREEKQTKSIG